MVALVEVEVSGSKKSGMIVAAVFGTLIQTLNVGLCYDSGGLEELVELGMAVQDRLDGEHGA